jgi:integrase/recombinase XerD
LQLTPSALAVEQLDAPLLMEGLHSVATARHHSPRTRNARLVAMKAFLRFLAYRVPALLEHRRRLLAIPAKKTAIRLVHSLTVEEMHSLLNVPALHRRDGLRDRAMLPRCLAAGRRVSEWVSLPLKALAFSPTPRVRVLGTGRKERTFPLWKDTAIDLRNGLAGRGETPACALVVTARGLPLTRSGCTYSLQKHVKTAAQACASLHKKRVAPHVVRHTSAMVVLHATGDIRKVALWLGHDARQTTEVSLRADPTEKLEAIDAVVPPTLKRGECRVPDKLIALLHGK